MNEFGIIRKYIFLTFFLYTILYIFPFPLTFVGVLSEVGAFYNEYSWYLLVPWVAREILGIQQEISTAITGSGDGLFYWLQVLVILCMSVLGAGIWIWVKKSKIQLVQLSHWLTVYILAFLIFNMISYGMAKVIKLQFSDPNLMTLTSELGQLSPFRLAWTFMGYSKLYTFFAGFCEVMGGLLLLFRRTRTLGAIVVTGVMFNVFMMNMSYDIPVKLYSFHLLFFAMYIMAHDSRRLINVLLFNKPTFTKIYVDHFSNPESNKNFRKIKFGVIGLFIAWSLYNSIQQSYSRGTNAPLPYLYGIYDVDNVFVNGLEIAPVSTDHGRWGRVLIGKNNMCIVKPLNRQTSDRYFHSHIDTLSKIITLTGRTDTTDKYLFKYQLQGKNLKLKGSHKSDSLQMDLQNYNLNNFLLLNKGFNWVNERPN